MAAKPKREKELVYFLGIKGVAMSALAIMARQLGFDVEGSDSEHTYSTEVRDKKFKQLGIVAYSGFDPERLKKKPDKVIVSAAYGPTNIEYKAAKSYRLNILTQSEFLGEIMQKFEGIGVSGVHGKTTTSALIAFILKEAGYSPSYSIGAPDVYGLDGCGHIGDGKYFVAEADEYRRSEDDNTPKFFDLPIKDLIISSIELDHPDIFESAEDVYEVFYKLSTKIPRDGTIIACTDWPLVRRLVSRNVDRSCLTYGFGAQAMYQIVDLKEGEQTTFSIKADEKIIGQFATTLPGKYNALNATSAIILLLKLGLTKEAIAKALLKFQGAQRRFQFLGKYNGAVIIDDYAHHPTAVAGVIEATKNRFPTKKVIVVFQPHTYSRTGKLLKEFADSLKEADKVILVNIFASAREKSGYVTIKDLVDKVRLVSPDVEYRSSLQEVAQYLKHSINETDVVLLVGAGDVYQVFKYIQEPDV